MEISFSLEILWFTINYVICGVKVAKSFIIPLTTQLFFQYSKIQILLHQIVILQSWNGSNDVKAKIHMFVDFLRF